MVQMIQLFAMIVIILVLMLMPTCGLQSYKSSLHLRTSTRKPAYIKNFAILGPLDMHISDAACVQGQTQTSRFLRTLGKLSEFGWSSISQYSNLAVSVPIHIFLFSILKLTNTQTLTSSGLVHATILGILLWSSVGLRGWSVAAVYFILGSLVTKFKMEFKQVFFSV